MKILSFVFPGFTALDLIGPTTIWGLMPGSEFQTVSHTPGPVKVDMGLEVVAMLLVCSAPRCDVRGHT
jgi:cyclohexyl-isocyanide hydratase